MFHLALCIHSSHPCHKQSFLEVKAKKANKPQLFLHTTDSSTFVLQLPVCCPPSALRLHVELTSAVSPHIPISHFAQIVILQNPKQFPSSHCCSASAHNESVKAGLPVLLYAPNRALGGARAHPPCKLSPEISADLLSRFPCASRRGAPPPPFPQGL